MKTNKGFTIAELMIALAIVSVILVIAASVMANIGKVYVKGQSQVSIQDTVRNISDNVSQHIKLIDSSGTVTQPSAAPAQGTAGVACIGNTRYTYVIGKQMYSFPTTPGSDQSHHVLWRDTLRAGATCTPADLDNLLNPSVTLVNGTASLTGYNGAEMLMPGSRLTAFCIGTYASGACGPATSGSSDYSITVGAAYGDSDLLATTPDGQYNTDTNCKGSEGQQFCGTARLSEDASPRASGSSGSSTSPPSGGCTSNCGGSVTPPPVVPVGGGFGGACASADPNSNCFTPALQGVDQLYKTYTTGCGAYGYTDCNAPGAVLTADSSSPLYNKTPIHEYYNPNTGQFSQYPWQPGDNSSHSI